MTNFGFNLLGAVQSVIGKQEYQLEKWLSRDRNSAGYQVDTYAPAVTRLASVQPLSAQKKQQMGLTMTSAYIDIYDVDLISLLSRDGNADRIIFQGYYWAVEPSAMDWNEQGGWNQVTAIRGDRI